MEVEYKKFKTASETAKAPFSKRSAISPAARLKNGREPIFAAVLENGGQAVLGVEYKIFKRPQ